MTARRIALLILAGLVPVVCLSAAASCQTFGSCGWIVTGSDSWWPTVLWPSLLVASLATIAWSMRLGISASRLSNKLAALPRAHIPGKLARSATAAGVDRIACITGSSPIAFCAGFLRPTIFVSQGAVGLLSEQELLAVLSHEADHARRREPMRRAAHTAAADVLVFLPIVRWWSQRQIERCELAADEAAERSVGREALAGALLVMTAPAHSMAAFGGHAEMRAGRLLGHQIEYGWPSRAVWAATLVYAWLAFSLAGCLLEAAVALT